MIRVGRMDGYAVAALLVLLSLAAPVLPQEEIEGQLNTLRRLGKAYYENSDYESAAAQFRRCIELAPESAEDRFNLALVLARSNQYEDVHRLLTEAQRQQPDLLNVHYLRGIIYKRQGRYNDAVTSLERVLAVNPRCWGAQYNRGDCYRNLRKTEQAKSAFQAATEIDPNHPSAYYQLMTLAGRAGDREEVRRLAEVYKQLQDTLDESEKTREALERSEYTHILVAHPSAEEPVDVAAQRVRFVDVTASSALETVPSVSPPQALTLPVRMNRDRYRAEETGRSYAEQVGGAVTLGDYDHDGDLDAYIVHCSVEPSTSGNRLFRNQGDGVMVDVTVEAGVGNRGLGMEAIFGDYDNDGHCDLYVVNYGPNVLYRNHGDGTFRDVSEAAGADEPQFGRQAAFVDYDHDNDLDLLVVNDAELAEAPESAQFLLPDDFFGQVNTLLRNNGNGTFTDRTDEAQLLVDMAQSRAVVFADFDGDHDTDLFIGNANAPSLFFANARLGKFSLDGSFTPSIGNGCTAVAENDFDRDGDADLLVAAGNLLMLYANCGMAHFKATPVPLPHSLEGEGVGRIEILDFDNDGWSDLLLVGSRNGALHLLGGVGTQQFRDVTSSVGLDQSWGRIADAAIGDLDGDGDEDILLLTRDHGPRLLRNESNTHAAWIDVKLVGEKVNRGGYGATVEVAAAGHYQMKTVRCGVLHFGLADLKNVDVVRVTWPNGVAQNAIRPTANGTVEIVEQARVSASCAMLWAFNGNRFELVNEILGVGPLGVPNPSGGYHQPDCTELTNIASHQLALTRGMYQLRVTGELREVVYADAIAMRVIDHPEGLEIIPNEMFTAPPFPEDRFFAVRQRRVPRSAVDDRGVDVLPLVLQRDGQFPSFPTTEYEGLAHSHGITLDLGDLSGAEQIMLYLDGRTLWPESSTVRALAQDPRYDLAPMSLKMRDGQGRWRTVIESVGLPTSKGAVVPVDLTGRFLSEDYHVRLETNMCVYLDRVFVSTTDEAFRCRVTELPVAKADLRYRGFSRFDRDRFGFERFYYDDVSRFGSWSPPGGMLTRYGDVAPLLSGADDMFVIFGPGDELALRFDDQGLPELPTGWVRDFILYASGWVKDGDLNTALSQQVEPLPFHGMSGYPYSPGEGYPRTERRRRYLRTYNTRPSRATVRRLSGREIRSE